MLVLAGMHVDARQSRAQKRGAFPRKLRTFFANNSSNFHCTPRTGSGLETTAVSERRDTQLVTPGEATFGSAANLR
ncbi:hypothetical protein Efla_001640 [Eimeria flavescens]